MIFRDMFFQTSPGKTDDDLRQYLEKLPREKGNEENVDLPLVFLMHENQTFEAHARVSSQLDHGHNDNLRLKNQEIVDEGSDSLLE